MATYSINELDDLLEKKIQMIIAEQERVNGITSFSAPYVIAQRITNATKKANEFSIIKRMDAYADIDTKNDILAKQLDDISNLEAKHKQDFFDTQKTKVGRDNLDYYLESYAQIIAKLRMQRIHYEKNGLNVFSLGKQAFMQLKKNSQVTFSEMKQSAQDTIIRANEAVIAKKESIINERERREEEANNKKDKQDMLEILNRIIKDSEALEKLKRKNPKVFNEIIGQNKAEDDDFISEVGIIHSSR